MKSQRDFIKHAIENNLIIPALIFGIAGFYSIPVMRFSGRVFMQKMTDNEFVLMLIVNPLKTAVFFSISIISVYSFSVLTGGRKSIGDYVISLGFIGLYFLCIIVLLTFVSIFSKYMSQTNNIEQWYVVTVILLVIVCIFFFIFTAKYGMVAVSEASGFEPLKSFLIWTISYIPSLLIFTAWVK